MRRSRDTKTNNDEFGEVPIGADPETISIVPHDAAIVVGSPGPFIVIVVQAGNPGGMTKDDREAIYTPFPVDSV
jgi:hypothetical protein